MVSLWKDTLSKISEKASESLADPVQYENLFPGYADTLKAEQYAVAERRRRVPAVEHSKLVVKFCLLIDSLSLFALFNNKMTIVCTIFLERKCS